MTCCRVAMSSFPSSSFRFQPRLIALALATLAGSACGTLANGRAWGEDATLAPGWERLRWAAHRNAVDPWTWLPIAGAAVLQIDDMDQRISRWARDETPVFGSQEDAEDASSTWRSAAGDLWLASLLAPPGGDAAARPARSSPRRRSPLRAVPQWSACGHPPRRAAWIRSGAAAHARRRSRRIRTSSAACSGQSFPWSFLVLTS